uniref:WSC domain-containing protein n=1 Tax=Acrobeloides nanus TaxID=290746 RepID=A0A914BZS1_9BILA
MLYWAMVIMECNKLLFRYLWCLGPEAMSEPCNLAPCPYPKNSCCNNNRAFVSNGQIVCTTVSTSPDTPSSCSIDTCCPTGGMWSEWSASGSCSDTCGAFGSVTYTRACLTGSSCPCRQIFVTLNLVIILVTHALLDIMLKVSMDKSYEDYGLHGVLGHLVAMFVVHVVCKQGQDRVDLLRMDAHVQTCPSNSIPAPTCQVTTTTTSTTSTTMSTPTSTISPISITSSSTTELLTTTTTNICSTTYLGCYTDAVSRILSYGAVRLDTNNSPMVCASICKQAGYLYAGVEYAYECWCGNSLNLAVAQKLPDGCQCNMACTGNSSFYCGAGFVYYYFGNFNYVNYNNKYHICEFIYYYLDNFNYVNY